jgi:type II secretory ATPase GspE/PulE/Tfp pilus assembly ATPase PilB-like protein
MGSDQILATLQSVSLFKELPESDLRSMVHRLVERTVQPDEIVVREGDHGDELFLIAQGEFQAFLRQPSLGLEKELRRLGPRDYFGEIALITGHRRMASIRALTHGRLFVLHRQDLHDLIARSPASALAVCRGMADYVSQANQGEAVVPFVKLDDSPALKAAQGLIPPRIALACRALAIEQLANKVKVALVDPQDTGIRTFLARVLRQYQVEFVAISERDFERHRAIYLGQAPAETAEPEEGVAYMGPEGVAQPLGENETAKMMQHIFGQALRYGASDVHFEPGESAGRIRLRVDGQMLTLPEPVPARLFVHLISRLKVMSELDITVRRLPQDGHFPIQAGDRKIEVRVAIIPCQGGEKAALRLLDPAQRKIDLHNLVLSRPVALLVKDMFASSSGLLLVCGPTGSGKTTTLYAGLNEIWRSSQATSIVTIEDPVEYHLEFATQIPVNRAVGLDFSHILRSILRQDPDTILVGEIRDAESAAIAVEAATTGHLVLSSLHTDFALEAIARLRNLQVKPYLLASALHGIISQKLSPRVCKGCAQPVATEDEHIAALKQLGILAPDAAGPFLRGRGCDLCRAQGEIGRVGIFEILKVSEQLRGLIEESESFTRMHESLGPNNFIPMTAYSRLLLEEGIVAPERVREIFPAKGFTTQMRM